MAHRSVRWLRPDLCSSPLRWFSGIFHPGNSLAARVTTKHPPPPCWPSGTPFHRPQQPPEEAWETEDGAPVATPQQTPLPEPPASAHLLPEPGVPNAEPTQVGAWAGGTWPCAPAPRAVPSWARGPHSATLSAQGPGASGEGLGSAVLGALLAPELHSAGCVAAQLYSPTLPPAPALPSSVLPCAPVSQPMPQFVLQGSLPLVGCGVAQSPAPVPTVLTAASEPAGHAATTNNSEERAAAPRPAVEKAKNEEVRSPCPPAPGVLSQGGRWCPGRRPGRRRASGPGGAHAGRPPST